MALHIAKKDSLTINGEGTNLHFKVTEQDQFGHIGALEVETYGKLNITANSMLIEGQKDSNIRIIDDAKVNINLTDNFISQKGESMIQAQNYLDNSDTIFDLTAKNIIGSSKTEGFIEQSIGIYSVNTKKSNVTMNLTAKENIDVSGYDYGVYSYGVADINLKAQDINIAAAEYGIYAYGNSNINTNGNSSKISSDYIGIYNLGGSVVNSSAKNIDISGKKWAIYNNASEVNLTGNDLININSSEGYGIVSKGENADVNLSGNVLNLTSKFGAFAGTSGKININTLENDITGDLEAKTDGEIVVLSNKNIVKGDISAEDRGKVSIINENGTSIISGNITASAADSEVIIKGKRNQVYSNNSNKIQEVSAFYDGVVDIDLREQGLLKGKVNDYRVGYDAGTSGVVKLNLDNGKLESYGKGSVTEVNLTNKGTIKFADKASSIDIGTLKGNGNGTFEMTVNSETKSDGNMIYVQNSVGGTYQIDLQNSDLSKIKVGDKIRFATIGEDAKSKNLEFEVLDVKEKGIKNVSFTVGYEDFKKGDSDNIVYNDEDNKSGNKYVETNYENGENWYLTRDEYKPAPEPEKPEEKPDKPVPEPEKPEIPEKPNSDEKINDIGKTVIEMARANYASAVYMDNLNKRLGDMSFVEGNSGLWVRMRNDKVGEDSEYRLHNYMTQIGYDKIDALEEGKEYRGIALEYTRGDMKYKKLNGKTEMDRYMFTAYDTRVYNSGLYADYTARVGYMSSDFEVTGRETGAKAEGDYHNLILGAGAEFGKKYDFGEASYFEPQVQLQYTYIDDADYTTNQNIKVNYEETHSLIGRVGIRIGHDFYKENSKDNTIYLKADINHEFLGEQDIKAQDVTGTINKTYENDNTWYDVGIGGAKNLTENLYVYADIERQFGEEKDNSWQFNLGFRYKFGSFKDFSFNAANLFDFDKSEVKPEGEEMIKNASEIMNKKKLKGTLSIEGHTDWTGSEEYNQILSEKRAKAVEEVFKENVTNENVKYESKGYGETRPIEDNNTAEGRAKNRRVEMKFNK